MTLVAYPSTTHLAGSKLARGEAEGQVPFAASAGSTRVWEEKVDGDHCGIGFDPFDGRLFLQARGREVDALAEPRFSALRDWAEHLGDDLGEVLGRRYVMFGEWCREKHTVFYDRLPHPFLEYDVHDRETGAWLSTAARGVLLDGLPIASVPVARVGGLDGSDEARAFLAGRRSALKSEGWRASLVTAAADAGLPYARVAAETDPSDQGEGLYLKVEEGDVVVSRHKFVLPGFMASIANSGSHWRGRRSVLNGLAPEAWG